MSTSSVPKDVSVVLVLRTVFLLMASFLAVAPAGSTVVDLRVGWNDDASRVDYCVFGCGGGHSLALSYSTACQNIYFFFSPGPW